MKIKPIRISIQKRRIGHAADRDRTFFRLPVEAAGALLSRLLNADGRDTTTAAGVAASLQAGHTVTEAWDRDGVQWIVKAARVAEGSK